MAHQPRRISSAEAAGTDAADAFSAALSRTYLEPADLGLGAMAEDARARAQGYREATGMLADAAGRPLASWQALRDAVSGAGTEAETALADAAPSADALGRELDDAAAAAGGAGAAARDAGAAATEGAEQAATGWRAVTAALADHAANAGRRAEVMMHEKAAGVVAITLLERPVRPLAESYGFIIRAGCDKRLDTSRAKFGNVAKFRGFPHIPGQDAVLR